MCDGSARGWLAGGRGRSGRARAAGAARRAWSTGLALHGKLLRPRPGTSNGGVLVQYYKVKGKGFPYSTPSVGLGADPGVQTVSLQVTVKSSTRR